MKTLLQKPDTFGAFTSTLCIVHCIGTPVLFVTHSCASHGCASAPLWWNNLDFIFLTMSFIAIYFSVKKSSNKYIKFALWMGWSALFALILNDKLGWFLLSELYTHSTALLLAVFHIYNLNYCQCKTEACCFKNE